MSGRGPTCVALREVRSFILRSSSTIEHVVRRITRDHGVEAPVIKAGDVKIN
jgi:hypothetical protein